MRKASTIAFLITVLSASPVLAQQSQAAGQPLANANPMTRVLQQWWSIADYVVRFAEAMPGDKYDYKPFADMRSFGEEIGHVADEHYLRCSRVRRESPPATRIEGHVRKKEELVARLKESVAFCDVVYATMTDATLTEVWHEGDTRGINLAPLVANIAHDNEHWGVMMMLMRMSGVVPPRIE